MNCFTTRPSPSLILIGFASCWARWCKFFSLGLLAREHLPAAQLKRVGLGPPGFFSGSCSERGNCHATYHAYHHNSSYPQTAWCYVMLYPLQVSWKVLFAGSWKVRKLDTSDMDVTWTWRWTWRWWRRAPPGPAVSRAVPSTPKRPSTSSFTWQWNRSINFGNPFWVSHFIIILS